MSNILTKEELAKVAELSLLQLSEKESKIILADLEQILGFITEINDLVVDESLIISKNINVLREDKIKPSEGEDILNNIPNIKENFFTVPKIIKQ